MSRNAPPPDLTLERTLWQSGLKQVAGMDEAGRGALAGPVAVGAVILPSDHPHLSQALACVRDSKQLSPPQRAACAPRIQEVAVALAVGYATAEEIDRLGIVAATRLAGMRSLTSLVQTPDYLLTDFRLDFPELALPQTALVKGDARCLSIACASVLAKICRDKLMVELEAQVPGYGLGQNKGYGTQAHRSALMCLGYSSIHRKSFIIKELRSTA